MTKKEIMRFDRDTWIDGDELHCQGSVYELGKLRRVYINFRAGTTTTAFLLLVVSFLCLGYGWFRYGDAGYVMLIPLVACFCFFRYMLRHYVELHCIVGNGRVKLMAAGIFHRQHAYELEDVLRGIIDGRESGIEPELTSAGSDVY